jgi:WD40 repeat protein
LYQEAWVEKTPFGLYHASSYQTLSLDLGYVMFTPNQKTLVTEDYGTVYWWNGQTGELQNALGLGVEDGQKVILSPDGAFFIHNFQSSLHATPLAEQRSCEVGVVEGRAYISPSLDHSERVLRLDAEPSALAITSDFKLIVGGYRYSSISNRRSDRATGVYPIDIYQIPSTAEEFSDYRNLDIVHGLYGHTDKVDSLLFSPDETLLLSQGFNRYKDPHRLWDMQTWELIRTYTTSDARVVDCLATLANGQVLASGSRNEAVTVWDVRTDEMLCVLPGKRPTVMSADGCLLVCRGQLGGLLVWDLTVNQEICTLAKSFNNIEPLLLSRDHQLLVTRIESIIQIWA